MGIEFTDYVNDYILIKEIDKVKDFINPFSFTSYAEDTIDAEDYSLNIIFYLFSYLFF